VKPLCVDSISEVISICADKTPGCLYRIRMPDVFYYSNNYGQYGSWVFRHNDISSILSGRKEGFVFNGKASHSEDYGINLLYHANNGYFGSLKAVEIDNQDSIGYALVKQYSILDSLWLLISYDNYENFEIQYVFDFGAPTTNLTRGYEEGEIYLYTYYWGIGDGRKLRFSNDYGQAWELKNEFNCPNLPIRSIVGGRQPGELYMVVEYIQLMHEIAHIYIYHSLDCGETFTVYHPFSYGPEPYVANFEGTPTIGTAPLTVQFTDLSTGENLNYWEWDFDNDGTIDSYNQNPEYTYQDTGNYSISLTIHTLQLDTATRFNYIQVTENSSCDEGIINNQKIELICQPNPFRNNTEIFFKLPNNIRNTQIEIYNIRGKLIDNIPINSECDSFSWDAEKLSSGIYFYRLSLKNSPVKKMILLK